MFLDSSSIALLTEVELKSAVRRAQADIIMAPGTRRHEDVERLRALLSRLLDERGKRNAERENENENENENPIDGS